MMFSRQQQGLGTRRLCFTSEITVPDAKLSTGWRASPFPDGVAPSQSRRKVAASPANSRNGSRAQRQAWPNSGDFTTVNTIAEFTPDIILIICCIWGLSVAFNRQRGID